MFVFVVERDVCDIPDTVLSGVMGICEGSIVWRFADVNRARGESFRSLQRVGKDVRRRRRCFEFEVELGDS